MRMIVSTYKRVADSGATMSFADLELKEWIVDTVNKLGIESPTPVQQNCIPPILQGRDVIGSAPTGSGKTAAFALPILDRLSVDPYGIFALVLTPTRELCFQISEQFKAFGAPLGLKQCVVVGGLDMLQQAQQLAQRPHIVVATPGRLAGHLAANDTLRLKKIKFLVLDEADRLLDGGFGEDLSTILSETPASRQTLLFTATMSPALTQLQHSAMTNPFLYAAEPEPTTVSNLVQHYLFVPLAVKDCYLVYMLREIVQESSAIVFVNTCKKCQLLYHMLAELGIQSTPLHSKQTMNRRLASLGKFRASQCNLLLATDVASRGLDIPEVDFVLNYDVPAEPADYIHRVGRTARAGRRGRAVSLVSQYDIEVFLAIEKAIDKKVPELEEAAEDDVLKVMTQASQAKRMAKLTMSELGWEEKHGKKRATTEQKEPSKKQRRGKKDAV